MENAKTRQKSEMNRLDYKSPFLFAIPLHVYEDEVGKDRDKESFQKIQQLEKKCEQLREKLDSFTVKHSQRLELTKSLALRTMAFHKYIGERKTKY